MKRSLPFSRSNKRWSVHEGITCDICQASPIRGVRYRCSVCPDFDSCEACVDNAVQRGPHDPTTHLYLRIPQTTTAVQGSPQVANRSQLVHHGFKCACCPAIDPTMGAPAAPMIVGVRYQCVQCQVDLCEACEAQGSHDPSHVRLKVTRPSPSTQSHAAVSVPSVAPVAPGPPVPMPPVRIRGEGADRPVARKLMLLPSSGRLNFAPLHWAQSSALSEVP